MRARRSAFGGRRRRSRSAVRRLAKAQVSTASATIRIGNVFMRNPPETLAPLVSPVPLQQNSDFGSHCALGKVSGSWHLHSHCQRRLPGNRMTTVHSAGRLAMPLKVGEPYKTNPHVGHRRPAGHLLPNDEPRKFDMTITRRRPISRVMWGGGKGDPAKQ